MRFILLIFYLSAFAWAYAAPGMDWTALEQAVLAGREAGPNCMLYDFQRQLLENYYRRTSFEDSSHQSGWYRVDDYLSWLKREEPRLKNLSVNLWDERVSVCTLLEKARHSASARKRLTVFLGARYALDGLDNKASLDEISFYLHPKIGAVDFARRTLFIPRNTDYNPVQFINLGIHETAHLFPLLKPALPQQPLGELAAYYLQSRLGLPVRPGRGICYSHGARNLFHTLSQTQNCQTPLREYHSFLAGILLQDQLNLADFASYRLASVKLERSVGEVVFHLILIRQGKLYVKQGEEKIPVKEKAYFASLFPPSVSAKKAIGVYQRILKLLPEEILTQPYSAVVLPDPSSPEEEPLLLLDRIGGLDHFLQENTPALQEALLKALQKVRVQEPVLPEGYI